MTVVTGDGHTGLSAALQAALLDVAILRWPEESAVLSDLRAAGTPRLLLVSPDEPAPAGTGCDEDWVRLPTSDDDVRVRAVALAARASRHSHRPQVKGDGRITYRGRWVALSEGEEHLCRILADQLGEVVAPEAMVAVSAGQNLSSGAIRLHIMRLRKRLQPLGLAVRTVRSRGYLMEAQVESPYEPSQ
ncbi:MAG TPA: helix-turn-helix domain-containing protein [Acidimicrobiales bacterium]|nr:helix-turn-helix domain-containing protein [Acidimicrobiales bacterium]